MGISELHVLMTRLRARVAAPIGALAVAAVLAPAAGASQMIGWNATGVSLQVDRSGAALVSYRTEGAVRHVLASGAVNALAPTTARAQVSFRIDYGASPSGFRNACTPVAPAVPWLVTACRAADGSLWAVQSWQRRLPNYGARATAEQSGWELRLSHWSGELPVLTVRFGWAYRRYQQLYGTLTYRGRPVYGFRTTRQGEPLDGFGRNVYLDTLASAYGPGWRRENSFLTHKRSGGFCYGLFPHGSHPAGTGRKYRATVIGPGVTPDVSWEGTPPGPYSREFDLHADADLRSLLAQDPVCHAV